MWLSKNKLVMRVYGLNLAEIKRREDSKKYSGGELALDLGL